MSSVGNSVHGIQTFSLSAKRMLSSLHSGISPVKSAIVYPCNCVGIRLSPTCSPVHYGLVFPGLLPHRDSA